MTKVGFISLGCCKNLVDTEVMLYNLNAAGFEITPNEEEAEIIVINTCGFIESASCLVMYDPNSPNSIRL